MAISIQRISTVIKRYSKSRSAIYAEIASGLFVPPVKIGLRAVGWPDNEIDEMIAARIAGKNNEQLRELVSNLIAAREEIQG